MTISCLTRTNKLNIHKIYQRSHLGTACIVWPIVPGTFARRKGHDNILSFFKKETNTERNFYDDVNLPKTRVVEETTRSSVNPTRAVEQLLSVYLRAAAS